MPAPCFGPLICCFAFSLQSITVQLPRSCTSYLSVRLPVEHMLTDPLSRPGVSTFPSPGICKRTPLESPRYLTSGKHYPRAVRVVQEECLSECQSRLFPNPQIHPGPVDLMLALSRLGSNRSISSKGSGPRKPLQLILAYYKGPLHHCQDIPLVSPCSPGVLSGPNQYSTVVLVQMLPSLVEGLHLAIDTEANLAISDCAADSAAWRHCMARVLDLAVAIDRGCFPGCCMKRNTLSCASIAVKHVPPGVGAEHFIQSV